MRFEGKAAAVVGILLPLLETYRRGFGHWRVEFTTMFEDYLAGALLLTAAWAAYQRRPSHHALLLVAWTWFAGMMTVSFVDQVEVTLRGVDLEPQNTDVLVVKFLLLAFALAGVWRSFQRLKRCGTPPTEPLPR
jgi:uncharacterized membrane protein YdcZ (DUF606 family)